MTLHVNDKTKVVLLIMSKLEDENITEKDKLEIIKMKQWCKKNKYIFGISVSGEGDFYKALEKVILNHV